MVGSGERLGRRRFCWKSCGDAGGHELPPSCCISPGCHRSGFTSSKRSTAGMEQPDAPSFLCELPNDGRWWPQRGGV